MRQGSHNSLNRVHARGLRSRHASAARNILRATLALLLLASLSATSFAENMRLRLAWGGGTARIWEARIQLSEGKLSDMRLLGLEADAPAAIFQSGETILIRPASPRTYDGFDILVDAPLSASINLDLAPLGDGRKLQQLVIPIKQLINDTSETALDNSGNRLVIRRAPGDRLRVKCDRPHMVFSPQEKITLDVQPHLVGLAPGEQVNCDVRLLPARGGEELFHLERTLLVASDGVAAATGPIEIDVPANEGAYDITLELKRPGRTRFLPSRILVQRSVQFVVVSPKKTTPATHAAWQTVAEIDPLNPKWWDRLPRLPGLNGIPGIAHGPLASGPSSQKTVGDRRFVALDPQAWQAFPVPVSSVGQPHILEVELPAGQEQTLGISLVEPNAAGKVIPLALDSGIDIRGASADPSVAQAGALVLHRLVFWPRTASPLVVLANRRDDRKALFGKIRTLAGPRELPPLANAPNARERLIAAAFARPALAANFGASDVLDPAADRNLDDWTTFLQSATRLAQYLRYSGYNAAVVPILHEGGTLFPSESLQGTARHDTGIFFSTGQDIVQKDVVELLMRVFDREGLRLIPAIQFASPISSLEYLRRQEDEKDGIELVNAEGRSWSELNSGRQALGSIYNPLDTRVQRAMGDVVREVTRRYAAHSAFAGVSLQLGPETYVLPPGHDWGLDNRTVRRFEAEIQIKTPRAPRETPVMRANLILASHRNEWLKWRAENLANFHAALANELSATRRDAKIFLATAEIANVQALQDRLKPALPRSAEFAAGMLAMGIDNSLYAARPNLVLLRPRVEAPLVALARQHAMIELDAPDIDDAFAQQQALAVQFYHEPLAQRLPALEEQSPFGAKNTIVYQAAQVVPADSENRRRFAHNLAVSDSLCMFDGGWQLPLGQEASLAPFLETFRALPNAPFNTVPSAMNDDGKNCAVVRTLTQGAKSYIYCVNDFHRPVTVSFELTGPADQMIALGSRKLPAPLARDGKLEWTVSLDAFDLVAAEFPANVKIIAWQAHPTPEVLAEFTARLRGVRLRAEALADQSPYTALLTNPAFELPPTPDSIPGWVFKRNAGLSVALDAKVVRNGKNSLRLKSDRDVLWVRSAPFAPPRTGRLAVVVWLKSTTEGDPPTLRLAIEARVNGQTYYRFAAVGAGTGAAPIKPDWAPYVFQVDDLPLSGISDLRVGFDLMGPGQVWIDDVELYDLWFYKTERDELAKLLALADFQLAQGKLADCRRMLDGYWPRFLETYVAIPSPRIASQPHSTARDPAPPAPNKPPPPPAEPASPRIFDRMRGLIPRVPSMF